jgi:hypothetical protein
LVRYSGGPDKVGDMPAINATVCPTMAALTSLQAGFGSVGEFDRIFDTVLGGIRDQAIRQGTR